MKRLLGLSKAFALLILSGGAWWRLQLRGNKAANWVPRKRKKGWAATMRAKGTQLFHDANTKRYETSYYDYHAMTTATCGVGVARQDSAPIDKVAIQRGR